MPDKKAIKHIYYQTLLLCLFTITVQYCFGQVEGIFIYDPVSTMEENFRLHKDGTFEYIEWPCSESATFGHGKYAMNTDTIIIVSYNANNCPIEVTHSNDSNHKDNLILDIQYSEGIIHSVLVNNTLYALKNSKKKNYTSISIPKKGIKNISVYYYTIDHKAKKSISIPVTTDNIYSISENQFPAYLYPDGMKTKWRLKHDTLFKIGVPNYYLVDSLIMTSNK